MKAGDTVYIINYKGEIEDLEIEKIGNKYFYIKNSRYKFRLEDLCSDFDIKKVYTDKQQIYDKKEHEELFRYIKKNFEWSYENNFTLDQLRRINVIIKESDK